MTGTTEAPLSTEVTPTGVAVITLYRPHRRNALNAELAGELVAALSRLAEDDDVRCVVVRGAGRDFCVGGDLADGAGGVTAPDEATSVAELRAAAEAALMLHSMPAPTIASIRGACAGAGLSLACAADLRVASTTALFTTAFVRAGVSGDYGGTWTLPRLVGEAKARELYLCSPRLTAGEAERIGLVTSVHDDDELDGATVALAEQLAALPPLALRGAKANLNDAATDSLADHLGVEAVRHARTAASADAAEAAAAFLGKRSGVFRGA
jgi:2-(1,2-epoxy-1,2-dihydrophenyl)acetyl-CoA isomerase